MIVVEERLRDLFKLIPNINGKSIYYSWGKKEELNRYIIGYNKDNKQPYPLVWLLPSEEDHNLSSDKVTKRLSIVLATLETRIELYNAQRYQGSYKTYLNPLTDYVLQALQNSSITRLIEPNSVRVFKEPNYSDREENGTIDKWDAVRIDCEVEFNNNCLKDIKWR